MPVAPTIRCPDCDGVANLCMPVEEGDLEPGDVLTYACEDCLSRWDVVVDQEDLTPDPG